MTKRLQMLSRWLVRRSGRFDAAYYLEEYPDVAASGVDPLAHYCAHGWREGRRPGPQVHPGRIAAGPIGRRFGGWNPVVAWMLVGRWLNWPLGWTLEQEPARPSAPASPRIAIIVHEATRTGAPIFALRLSRWLRRTHGCDPLLVLMDEGSLTAQFIAEFPCLPLFALRRSERAQALRQGLAGVELVYFNSLAALGARAWLDWYRGPLVLHAHESGQGLAMYADALAAIAPERPLAIAVNEEAGAALCTLLGTPAKIVPPAIERDGAAHVSRGERRRVVAGCGTRSRRKGADLFCRVAAAASRMSGEAVEFLWLGGPGDVDMAALARELGVERSVRLAGEVPDPLPDFRHCALLLLPSREDPFPLVALEAASCGLPTVCFDTMAQGVGTWVSQGAGHVVPAFDIDAMAAAVLALLDDPAQWQRASQGALSAAARYDIEAVGPRIGAVIERAVGRPLAGAASCGSGHHRNIEHAGE